MSLDTISLENEIWKPIPEWEQYLASSHGRIYSLKTSKLLKHYLNKFGYSACSLSDKERRKTFRVHRLIILAFVGPSELSVDHLDGNKTNNHIDNLEYVTLVENSMRVHRKRGIAGCYKMLNGRYAAQININGKRKRIGIFSTYEEAKTKYDEVLYKRENDLPIELNHFSINHIRSGFKIKDFLLENAPDYWVTSEYLLEMIYNAANYRNRKSLIANLYRLVREGHLQKQNNDKLPKMYRKQQKQQPNKIKPTEMGKMTTVIEAPKKIVTWSTDEERPYYEVTKEGRGVYLRIGWQKFSIGGNYDDVDGPEYDEKHKDLMVKLVNQALDNLTNYLICK